MTLCIYIRTPWNPSGSLYIGLSLRVGIVLGELESCSAILILWDIVSYFGLKAILLGEGATLPEYGGKDPHDSITFVVYILFHD